MKYNIRIADDVIKKCIVDYDIINVEGIRSSGKSSICINFSKTSFLLEEQNTKEDIFIKHIEISSLFNLSLVYMFTWVFMVDVEICFEIWYI